MISEGGVGQHVRVGAGDPSTSSEPSDARRHLPTARQASSTGAPPHEAERLDVGAGGLALSGQLGSADTPSDVVDILVLEAFASGRQPFARTRDLTDVRPDAPLTPAGATVVREARSASCSRRLAAGPGWTLHSAHWLRSRSATVTVTATSAQLAEEVVTRAVEGAADLRRPEPDSVRVDFWHLTERGPRRTPRRLDAAAWAGVRDNYSAPVAAALDGLIALTPDDLDGRLLLMHGPPGTGKTTLLRTLAREWRSWCRLDCVLDPERLLDSSSYLLDVALGEAGDADDEDDGDGEQVGGTARPPAWRMLLLEDCDELIRAGAAAGSGQHLSRLLNLTDGLLGQGRRVLVAITTNQDLAGLHPAVARPGRALAQVEVGRLGQGEARAWLERSQARTGCDASRAAAELAAVGPGGATLAELVAVRAGHIPSPAPADGVGLYL